MLSTAIVTDARPLHDALPISYEIGYEKIIDTYAQATQHVDQGLSLTLFFKDTATTRDVNRAQIYAWRKGDRKSTRLNSSHVAISYAVFCLKKKKKKMKSHKHRMR